MLSFALAFTSNRVHVSGTSRTALAWNPDDSVSTDQKMLSAAIGSIMIVYKLLFVGINLLLSLRFKAGMWTLLLITSSLLRLLLHGLFVAHDGSIATVYLPRSAVHTLINAKVIHKMNLVLTKVLMLGCLSASSRRDHLRSNFLALIRHLFLHLHLTRSIAAHKVTDLRDVVVCSSSANFLASNNPSSSILLNLALGRFLVLFPDQVLRITSPLDYDRIINIGGLRRILLAAASIASLREHAHIVGSLHLMMIYHWLVCLSHLGIIALPVNDDAIIGSIRSRINTMLILLLDDQYRGIASLLSIFRTITVLVGDSVGSFRTRLNKHTLT